MNENDKPLSVKKYPYYLTVFSLWVVIVLVALFVFKSMKQFTKDNLISEYKGVANNISNFSTEPLLFGNLARVQLDVVENQLVFLNRLDFVHVLDTGNKILLSNHEQQIGETYVNQTFHELILEKTIKHIQHRDFVFKIYANPLDNFYSLSIRPALGRLDYYPDGVFSGSIYFSLTTDEVSRGFAKIFYALVLGTIATIALLSVIIKLLSDYYIRPFSLFLGKLTELSSGISEPMDREQIKGPLKKFVAYFNQVIYRLMKTQQQKEKELEVQKGFVRATQVLAHDVRKPFSQVSLILGSFDKFRSDAVALHTAKREVEKSITNVESMIDDILDYSRKVEFSTEPCSLYRIFEYAIKQSSRDFPVAEVSFEYRLAHRFMPLVDESRLIRVFGNIVTNAIEAITAVDERQQGTITFSSRDIVRNQLPLVEITIGNNGPLFKHGTVNRLFDTFYTHAKSKGTGLGLASAQKIIHLHKGTITARNRDDGTGVEFITNLPSSDKPEASKPVSLPERLKSAQMAISADSKVYLALEAIGNKEEMIPVVLLEDEVLYRAGIRDLINSEPTLSKKVILYDATTVEDALALLENNPIEHAIVDIDLNAAQTGHDFLTTVRDTYPSLNCLVHTNRTTAADQKEALALGAKHFASKPLSLACLVGFINDDPAPPKSDLLKAPRSPVTGEDSLISVLAVDDDPFVLQTVCNLTEDCFSKADLPHRLLTASNYKAASEMLETCHSELNYVISDLNIDSISDGLRLAEKNLELSNRTGHCLPFYIITHADVAKFNRRIDPEKVKQFYRHPISEDVLTAIFEQTRTHSRLDTPASTASPPARTERIQSTVHPDIENHSLPDLLKMVNEQILRKVCSIIGHEWAGELQIMKHDILQANSAEASPNRVVQKLPLTLTKMTEQLQSILDIVYYSETHNLKDLLIGPFTLKLFIDQFIQQQSGEFSQLLTGLHIENRIDDSELEAVGDETLFEKVLRKVLLYVAAQFSEHEKEGSIVFKAIDEGTTSVLQMICNIVNEDFSEDAMNRLFNHIPFTNGRFDPDFAACSYLMSLHEGRIAIELDPNLQTTSYCFILEKNAIS